MENIYEIPTAILALLESKDFDDLTQDEKWQTKAFLSEEQYAKLRETLKVISLSEKNYGAGIEVRPQTEKALLNVFKKEKQQNLWVGILQYRIPAWQAAAVILFLFSFFLFAPEHKSELQTGATITDTVKVVKHEIEKILVYDTIFFKENQVIPKHTNSPGIALVKNQNDPKKQLHQPLNYDGLSVLTLQDTRQIRSSGNSLSDDSLINKFNFVSIN